jgi:putative ABC transport system permease protein
MSSWLRYFEAAMRSLQLHQLWQDVKYGTRLLARTPGFAVAAALTIALGIGATTAMFSVVYGVLLQPLPYREPDRLVDINSTTDKREVVNVSSPMAVIDDWRARNQVFEGIAAVRAIANFNLTGWGDPERLNGARVSSNLFAVLGVSPLVGRTFTAEEETIGRDRVALLTYGLWVRRFAADQAIVGRTIALSGEPYTVVGVMRPDFAFPTRDYQIYVPLTFDPRELIDRAPHAYLAFARLKPGVSIARAQADVSAISAQLDREYPRTSEGTRAEVVPMLADTVSAVRQPLYVLLAAVAAMLLIGCANLTNLLLARSLTRQRELAVRAALGASRGRLVAQSVTEIAPLLAIGGALGLVAAAWTIDALVPLLPADLPRVENIGLSLPVLAGATLTLLAMAVFIGVWPAIDASRGELSADVQLSRGNTGTRHRARVRDGLVVVQIAATLWLVVGATLLMRSLAELRHVNPGFNTDRVYSLHLAIPRAKYPKDADVAAFCARVIERVGGLPDVLSVGMVNRLPLGGGVQIGGIEFEGVDPHVGQQRNVDYRTATPDYFRTLEIPIVAGRTFTEADDERALPVAIIDERLARTVFASVDPIGRRVRIPVANLPWLTIVGVAGHIRHDRLDEDLRPQIYFNYKQRAQDRMAVVVRSRTDAAALAPSLMTAIRSIDPEQPVYDARTLEAVVDRSVGQRWLQTTLLTVFATIALILASVGVYGVIAYTVGQRWREFGIRLALGARREEIVALVLRRGLRLFAIGAVLGLAAAAATAKVIGALLYKVPAFDPMSLSIATAMLFLVAAAACGLPARRAAHVDPAVTLRTE